MLGRRDSVFRLCLIAAFSLVRSSAHSSGLSHSSPFSSLVSIIMQFSLSTRHRISSLVVNFTTLSLCISLLFAESELHVCFLVRRRQFVSSWRESTRISRSRRFFLLLTGRRRVIAGSRCEKVVRENRKYAERTTERRSVDEAAALWRSLRPSPRLGRD